MHSAVFLINSCSQLVSSTDFSSIREGLHLHISVPSPEVTAPFCLVPSPEFSQAPWYSLPDHLCRFGVRAAAHLAPKLFSADGITGYRAIKAPIITPRPMLPPDLPGGGAARLTRENHLPGRLPVRVTPCARPQDATREPEHHRPTRRKDGSDGNTRSVKGPLIGHAAGTGISTRSSIRLRLSASP